MTLGERLRDLRVNGKPYRKLREAAADASIHHVRLSKFENDRERPTASELSALATTYAADFNELAHLWDEWSPAPPPDFTTSICSGRVQPSAEPNNALRGSTTSPPSAASDPVVDGEPSAQRGGSS